MKRLILILTLIYSVTYCDTTKVLFIGNSYTYVNDLPTLFKNLSESGGKVVYTEMQAPGGYSLENHLNTPETIDAIAKGIWKYVVLQEQSQIPVIEFWRNNSMYPSAKKLDSIIKFYNPNAKTVFYMTWGRKNGGQQCIDNYCSVDFKNFYHMQDSLKSSYRTISNILAALLSPAGEGWRMAKLKVPTVNLWDTDESHPTLDGSFLTACVFYATIFEQNPTGLTYNAGLPDSLAQFYKQCAWQSVKVNNISKSIQGSFELYQNYPNPFNGNTLIKFQISNSENGKKKIENSLVVLKVYNILGKEIATLVNEKLEPGIYTVPFSISQYSGYQIPSGVYIYNLVVDNILYSTRKMVLIK